MISRRSVLALVASSAPLAVLAGPAFAQRRPPTPGVTVDVTKLMAPGALDEKVLGNPDAKVTIVEYASYTCGHCAAFHRDTLPKLKAKYIEPGKVKLVFREFPFDPIAAAVSMLVRCAPADKYFEVGGVFFEQQATWARAQDVVGGLRSMYGQLGFTQEQFQTCLTNQALLDGVNKVKDRGALEFGVDSTPTFFINGVTYKGAMSIEDFDAILAPLLI
jgi:protein-disulfide isomerase